MSESQYDDQGTPAQQEPESGADPTTEPAAGPADAVAEENAEPVEDEDAVDLSAAAPSEPVEHTGNPVVDSVLDSLQDLDRLPPAEHVAVFEAAHERLRSALSDAGDPPAES